MVLVNKLFLDNHEVSHGHAIITTKSAGEGKKGLVLALVWFVVFVLLFVSLLKE